MIFLPGTKALLLLSFYFFRTSGLMWCLDAKLSRVVHQKSQKTVNVWMICLQHLGQRGPNIAVAVQNRALQLQFRNCAWSTHQSFREYRVSTKQARRIRSRYAGHEAARITFDFLFSEPSLFWYQILKWNPSRSIRERPDSCPRKQRPPAGRAPVRLFQAT